MIFFCDFTSKMLLKSLPHYFARKKKKKVLFFSEACWLFSMNFSESDKSGMLLLQWTKRYSDKCCCTENCFGVCSPGKVGKHPYCHDGVMFFPLKKALVFYRVWVSTNVVTVFLKKNLQFSC